MATPSTPSGVLLGGVERRPERGSAARPSRCVPGGGSAAQARRVDENPCLHPSEQALHLPRLREKAPTNRCGAEKWEVSVKLLDPPSNQPNTRVGEADLISHRSADVQVAPVHVRPAVDDRDIVCTPSCVTYRKLGSKRQGTVRRTPRRGRHHLPRGRVGSWHRVPGGIPRLGFCLVGG